MVDDFEDEDSGGLLDRIKESPRTVSALIIILIVAAAIYAFSGDNDDNQQPTDESVAATEEAGEAMEDGETADDDDAMAEKEAGEEAMMEEQTQQEPTQAPQPVSQQELRQQSQDLPTADRSDEGYVETAQAGDGLTHLARRTTTRWLSENRAGYNVTNEHRVYIEDYIQKHLSDRGPVRLDDSRTIPFDLITEAVEAAGNLNEQQLQNLTQYSHVLS